VHVSTPSSKGIFDTGKSDLFLKNAEILDVDISKISWIALSHGHYDHAGGVLSLFDKNNTCTFITHPRSFMQKHAIYEKNEIRPNGIAFTKKDVLENTAMIIENNKLYEISKDIWMSGEIERVNDFEFPAKRFLLPDEKGGFIKDDFADDQSLIIRSEKGMIVLLGCAHSGTVNILTHVSKHFPDEKIHALIGGTHLGAASDELINKTADYIEKFDIDFIAPCHCTGDKATEIFKNRFGKKFNACSAGSIFEF
jgi:7,8-dihydropterin-6-yl-methyl-4-(beta-D-ribofuranosyl)aminobenzene 5'-phosphate synthase